MAPLFYFIIFKSNLPEWGATTLLVALGVGICLAILPAMKGFFIALIWTTKAPTS